MQDNSTGDSMALPLPIVSCDGHAGPRLVEDLRPYCPQKYLSKFDEYVAAHAARQAAQEARTRNRPSVDETGEVDARRIRGQQALQNIRSTRGHYDIPARLKDMDKDGVCAEVVYPTTHNTEAEPFVDGDLTLDPIRGDKELFRVGMQIYASWLVDACKQAHGRMIGLVTPPLWDVDASIEAVQWGAERGLRGVCLLMPRPGILRYDRPEWKPFWAACDAFGMQLHTHSGAPLEDGVSLDTPAGAAALEIEIAGWPARKALHQMIFSGVFERHPKLKIIFTEQNFDWWVSSIKEFDSIYMTYRSRLKSAISRKPSEYMATNVYIGASFLAPFEAEDAVLHGYSENVVWGRDYGHVEGTFVVTDSDDPAENPGRLSMRHAFANVSPSHVTKMASDNGIRFLGLDRDAMLAIARRIKSPTLAELTTPIPQIPLNGGLLAFRQLGAWY